MDGPTPPCRRADGRAGSVHLRVYLDWCQPQPPGRRTNGVAAASPDGAFMDALLESVVGVDSSAASVGARLLPARTFHLCPLHAGSSGPTPGPARGPPDRLLAAKVRLNCAGPTDSAQIKALSKRQIRAVSSNHQAIAVPRGTSPVISGSPTSNTITLPRKMITPEKTHP